MWLRIPTGVRQTSWLFTSVAEDLVGIQIACRVCGRKCLSVTIHLPRFCRPFGENCLFVVFFFCFFFCFCFFIAFKYFLSLLWLFFLLVKNVFKASSKLIRIFSKPHFSTRKLSTFRPHENRESARNISFAYYSCKKYEVSKIP